MKASELIIELQKAIDKYGDLPVRDWQSSCLTPEYINRLEVYTEHGNFADLRKRTTDPPVEIILY